MRSDCPKLEDILRAGGLGADHPLPAHLAACARCRSLLAAHDRFLADPPAADAEEDARLADADQRLAAFTASLPAGGVRRGRAWTWPLGLAAVIVAASGLWLLGPDRESAPGDGTVPAAEQTWRGNGSEAMPGPAPRAELLADGRLRLDWTAVTGADRYEVVVLAADLAELARWDAGSAATLTLAPEALPADELGRFFAVAAFAAERELGHWAPVPLP